MDTRTKRGRHPHKTTIGQLATSYLLHMEPPTLAKATYRSYATSIRMFVEFVGSETPLDDITDLPIQRWARSRQQAGTAPNTVRSDLRRLRYGLFSWAVKRKLVEQNWAALAKPPAEPDEAGRIVTEPEFGRMLAACDDRMSPYRDKAMLWLLWDGGFRVGEFTQLELADIDFERDVVHVRAEITKTQQERWVPFLADTKAALYDYIAFQRGMKPGRLWVSGVTGEPLTEQTPKHLVRQIGVKAGLEVGAHDFRRALVCRLQAKGVPDSLIMRITGHKTIAMIIKYGKRLATQNADKAYRAAFG